MKQIVTIFLLSFSFLLMRAQTAISLSGLGEQHVVIDSIHSLNFHFDEEFTVEAWSKPNELNSYQTIVSNYNGIFGSLYSGFWLGIDDKGIAAIQVFDSSSTLYSVEGTTKISDGKWHHVAGTYFNDSMYIYVDGKLEGSGKGPVKAKYSNQLLSFGNDNLDDYYLGALDNIRIWNKARTSDQIDEFKDSCLSGKENNLSCLWHFDEGKGFYVYDLTSNGNNGYCMYTDSITSWVAGTDFCQKSNVKENINTGKILIYPNPVNSKLTFEFKNSDEYPSIQIFDFKGNQVTTQVQIFQNQLDVSRLAAGNYWLKWNANTLVGFEKFIICR